ncbi:hypothetical protein LOTGIDRAFT_126078 [Lottia gigantea]|uniref:Sialin n=1 Tax=Lottia gigantea TaxID=225164 RepID=V4BIS0_LOTGI|nr:hypothetical protein LOTGIDRAFT_126078 [Lottia gigantea]ESO88514.1 hypothetical protein LOTGIDRAFT_126078 [Lottia gigantea]
MVPKRYLVSFMAFLGFANVYALRVNLSVAIVAMTSNKTIFINNTAVGPADYNWDLELQGHILSAFFWGYVVTQLPGGLLANRYGGKYFFGGGIFITAVLSLLTPLFVTWSVYLLISIRVLQGFCEGVTYPAIHAIWSKWAPPQERSKLATFAFSGSYIGTVISLPISGALAHSPAGWPSIFYVCGNIGILWFMVWCVLVTESPAKHPSITNAELEYIQQTIGYTDEQTKRIHPPWARLLTSIPVWALCLAHFAENWGFYTWLTELPTFMNDVLNFRIQNSGFLSALPYLVLGLVVMFSGQLADILRTNFNVSTTLVRKLFTCGAFAIQSVFMITAGYLMTPVAAIVCLTIAVGLGGFFWAGVGVNHLDIAPQYASILMGLSNTFATLPGIISPSLTGAIVSMGGESMWRVVFYLAASIYGVGAIFYGVFASGDRQAWAEIPLGYQPHLDDPERD